MSGIGMFIGGLLCGSVGFKVLKSKSAKKIWFRCQRCSYGNS